MPYRTSHQLRMYAKEMGVSSLTVEDLIASHRSLRETNRGKNAEWQNELERARKRGYEEGFQHVTDQEYIKLSKLRQMTLSEIAPLVWDENVDR